MISHKRRPEEGTFRGTLLQHQEEDVALATKGKQNFNRGEQKKDLSKVRCFACNEYRHYAGQCPHKKKNKEKRDEQVAATEEVDEFTNRFESEFSLASFVLGRDSSQPEVHVDERWFVDCKHCSHDWNARSIHIPLGYS